MNNSGHCAYHIYLYYSFNPYYTHNYSHFTAENWGSSSLTCSRLHSVSGKTRIKAQISLALNLALLIILLLMKQVCSKMKESITGFLLCFSFLAVFS